MSQNDIGRSYFYIDIHILLFVWIENSSTGCSMNRTRASAIALPTSPYDSVLSFRTDTVDINVGDPSARLTGNPSHVLSHRRSLRQKPRRRYSWKCMVTACAVQRGTGLLLRKQEFAGRFVCGFNLWFRSRKIFMARNPSIFSGTPVPAFTFAGWINTREQALADRVASRTTPGCTTRADPHGAAQGLIWMNAQSDGEINFIKCRRGRAHCCALSAVLSKDKHDGANLIAVE